MSKEFEELVLKKLDRLNTIEDKISNTDKAIKEVIVPKLDKIDVLEEKISNTDKMIQEVVLPKLDKIDVLEEKISNTDKIIQEVILPKLDKIDVLEEKSINTDKTLKEISSNLKNLNDRFSIFDYEINKKIDSLFDAFVVNTEKDSVHEEKIESLDKMIFNHDIRISNLESKIITA